MLWFALQPGPPAAPGCSAGDYDLKFAWLGLNLVSGEEALTE